MKRIRFSIVLAMPIAVLMLGCSQPEETLVEIPPPTSESPNLQNRPAALQANAGNAFGGEAHQGNSNFTAPVNQSSTAAGNSFSPNGLDSAGAPNVPTSDQFRPLPPAQETNPVQAASAVELIEKLENLNASAQRMEQAFQFSESEKIWAKIQNELESRFGKQAWQVDNAVMSRKVARISSGFDQDQLNTLTRIQELGSQITESFNAAQYPASIKLAKQTYTLTSQLYGDESPLAGKQQLQLGRMYLMNNELDQAVSCFDRTIVILAKTFSHSHPDLCQAYDLMGEAYVRKQSFPLALINLKSATRMAGEVWGEDSAEYAKRANNLGVAYYNNRELDHAFRVLKAAQILRIKHLGLNDPSVAHSAINLGVVLMEQQKFQDAINFFSQAMMVATRATGQDELVYRANEKLASAYMMNNQAELAEPILESLVQMTSKYSNNNLQLVSEARYRYAVALCRQGKYEMAEPILAAVLEQQKQKLGLEHVSTSKTVKAYSLLLQQTNQTEKAAQLNTMIRTAKRGSESNFK